MRRLSAVIVMLGLVAGGRVLAQSLFEECRQKKEQIEQMKQQLVQMRADISALDARVADLERQRRETMAQRARKIEEHKQLQKSIAVDEALLKRSCAPLRECEGLEQRVEGLKRRIEPMQAAARALRGEIDNRRGEQERLSSDINQLTTSYNQLNCANLVAGQTEQHVIDRCNDIFSRWNQAQKDLDRLDGYLKDLRTRYRRLMQDTRATRAELARLLTRIRTSCRHSSALAELERMDQEYRDWEGWDVQLRGMENSFGEMKRLKVVRPELRPAPTQPKLKPVKKHELKKVQ